MKWKLAPSERPRYALAIVAGLLLAASFPRPNVAGLAWVAPGLLLAAALGMPGGPAFRIGLVGGFAHFLASLYWLLLIPAYVQLVVPIPIAPFVGWLALSLAMAVFTGLWVWLCWKIYPVKFEGASGLPANAAQAEVPGTGRRFPRLTLPWPLLDQFLATSWVQRLGWAFACAALWVACEMVRARIFSGFPWNLLGASQYQMLPLIQVASITGVYGVSFLVVWFSVALFCMAVMLCRRPEQPLAWSRELLVPLLAALAVASVGLRQVLAAPEPGARLKIALVQPSIPQTTIWDPQKAAERFAEVMALSEKALQSNPDLLVWPEAAVPNLFRWDTNQVYQGQTVYDSLTSLARQHRVWLIMGADDAEPVPGKRDEVNFYNSGFLVSPQGDVRATYRKQQLVIFGEYVPLSRWLPFLKDFTQVYGEFTAGNGPVPFILPDLRVKTSVLICFEDVFPHLARRYVEPDTDFLLNLTNDGWFGNSAAQWQQAANAVFRAVENGLPLVRCANNGITCWIDAQGRLHDVYFPGSTDVYQAGYKVVQVPLLAGQERAETFYTRHGDWFGWACVGLAVVCVGLQWVRRRKPQAVSRPLPGRTAQPKAPVDRGEP